MVVFGKLKNLGNKKCIENYVLKIKQKHVHVYLDLIKIKWIKLNEESVDLYKKLTTRVIIMDCFRCLDKALVLSSTF
jgi:hypothetical protein